VPAALRIVGLAVVTGSALNSAPFSRKQIPYSPPCRDGHPETLLSQHINHS
jgi:hypothetical protein